MYNFLKYNVVETVRAVAPKRTKNFCQLEGMDLRNIDEKWFES